MLCWIFIRRMPGKQAVQEDRHEVHRHLDEKTVTGASVTSTAPSGGVTRMSRRVVNLAHVLTQNARRYADRDGFICGDRSWTWREIDIHVSALASAIAADGCVKCRRSLAHSSESDECVCSMS